MGEAYSCFLNKEKSADGSVLFLLLSSCSCTSEDHTERMQCADDLTS